MEHLPANTASSTPGRLRAEQDAFKDLKFGMFIHWSLFSLPTGHQNWRTPESAVTRFSAEKFDASSWVQLARDAGARYMTFTAKHHDGFCLFSSDLTNYDSMHSPTRRDFVRLLADECRAKHLPLFLYYSLPDHHHPSFKPGTGAEWDRYVSYYQGQIRELCANYGEIAGLWLDPGPWHGPAFDYRVTETQQIMSDLQPGALLMGRDFYEAEKRPPTLPGYMGFLDDHGEGVPRAMPSPAPDNWPFEVCDTINDSWHFNQADRNFKSPHFLIRKLVGIVGDGGNYLLNVAPMASGEVPTEQKSVLMAIGSWLRKHGDSIYGTRPISMPGVPWGYVVSRQMTAYLHVLDPPSGGVELPDADRRVKAVHMIDGGKLASRRAGDMLVISLPYGSGDGIDAVVVAELGNPCLPGKPSDFSRH